MRYVHLLQSIARPEQRYTGATCDLRRRLGEHNEGKSAHTARFRPWRLVVAIAFRNDARADEFERYLKSGSGAALARRHLW